MKKVFALVLALAMALGLTACTSTTGGETGEETVDVVVFAAASMEASLTEIAQQYKTVAPNVNLVFTFDSSGTLKTQIEEGAVCDLFDLRRPEADEPAGQRRHHRHQHRRPGFRVQRHPDRPGGEQGGAGGARRQPQGHPDLLRSGHRQAVTALLGNDDVPVGAYSLEILDTLGIDIAQLENDGKVTYASNVSEVANQVKERGRGLRHHIRHRRQHL